MIFHRFRCFRRVIPFPRWTDDNKNQKNLPLQYAGWSPTGHGLTFVFQNNLYYQQSPDHTPYQVRDILGFQLTNFSAKNIKSFFHLFQMAWKLSLLIIELSNTSSSMKVSIFPVPVLVSKYDKRKFNKSHHIKIRFRSIPTFSQFVYFSGNWQWKITGYIQWNTWLGLRRWVHSTYFT